MSLGGTSLLDLSRQGNRNEILKLLRSSTNEQISDALHLQLRRSENGSVADVVRIIFQDSTDSSGASRRLNVYKVAIKLLQDQDITNRAASEIVGLLLMETDNLTASHLAELAGVFTDAVKRKEPINGKAFELLPQIILSLAAKETVSYGNDTMTGVEYKNHVLNTLCCSRWDPHCLIHLAAMFRDVSLTSDQLKLIMTKILRLCKDVDIEELPPLVYQLLLLATKGHKRLVLSGLTSYLTKQDKLCKAQHQEQNQNVEALSTISQVALRRMEGTIILHITFAIKQDQELGKEFIKFLEASKLSNTAAVLSPFNVALALSIARIHRFEEPIFNILKNVILKSFKDAERQSASHWISEIAPGSADVTELILDTVQNSSYGWDHVTQGLVQLGFTLMDAFGPKAGPKGKSKENPPCTNTPNQRACSLGSQILVTTFKAHEMVRAEILEQLLNRIVTKESTPVSHYIGLLANTVTSAPQILLDSLPKMREAFEYLAFLDPSSADGLLKAVQPLMKLNVSLKDSLLLVLRKAMFARHGDARKIAVSGYLQILKHFQVDGILPASQISSQSYMSSSSQTMVDIHTGGNQQTNYEAIVCLEILGSLRRCFTQQAEVKMILYEGLYEVLCNNSKLKDTIVDMLSKQWTGYYEADEDINPPIKLQRCIMAQGDQVYISESLSHLLQCICHCVVRCKKLLEQSNDDENEEEEDEAEMHMRGLIQQLESVLSSLTRRMIKSDLEDFELDKSADFSETGSVGVKNNIFGSLVSGVYEVLMEYNFTNTDYSATSAEQLLQLFSNYHKLSEILRDKSSQKNKAGPKATRSLLSIKFVARTLKLLFSDDTPDRQECLIMLREESDFVRFIVSIALEKVHQLNEKGQCEGPAGNNMEKLYQFCYSVSRVFLHKFTADIFTQANGVRNERKKAVSSMCLEGLSTSVNVICSRFPERIAGYLRLIDPDLEAEDDHTDTLDEEERVHLHIKKFQRLVMDMLTSDDGSSTKDAVHLCNIITLLAKQLHPQGPLFVQLQAWLSRVCAEQNIEDNGLAKVLLGLLFTLTQQFQSTATLIRDVAQDIHSQIGDIEDVEVEPSTHYSIVNAKTAAPTVLLLLMSQIETFLEETEWALKRMNADIGNEPDEETEGSGLTQREDGEKIICGRLGMLVNAFHELVQSAVPVGPCVGATLKAVTRLFTTVTLLCKYYQALYTQQAGHLSSRFEKLIRLLATRLTQKVYSMITYIQTLQSNRLNHAAARTGKAKEKKSGEGDASGTSGKAKGVMKETRAIPNLIYAIEQCEQFLIKLSKKSKVDLMEHFKLSTSRDFRIIQQLVQEVTEAVSDEESLSDDESQPPSKRRKTDSSSGKAASSSGKAASSSGKAASSSGKAASSSGKAASQR